MSDVTFASFALSAQAFGGQKSKINQNANKCFAHALPRRELLKGKPVARAMPQKNANIMHRRSIIDLV
jgi:hypothetical protein